MHTHVHAVLRNKGVPFRQLLLLKISVCIDLMVVGFSDLMVTVVGFIMFMFTTQQERFHNRGHLQTNNNFLLLLFISATIFQMVGKSIAQKLSLTHKYAM